MSDIFKVRTARSEDESALRKIWRSCFDDSDETIATFFRRCFVPEQTAFAEIQGTPAAAGYLMPAGTLISGGGTVPCSMIYAVATLPERRSLGMGTEIVRMLASLGRSNKNLAVAICPAEDSLFDYYSSRVDFTDMFFVRERRLMSSELPRGGAAARPVSFCEYSALRERLLSGVPHIKMDDRALEYQEVLCKEHGGGFFEITMRGGVVSCAVVERQKNGEVSVKELLSPKGTDDAALAALAEAFPSDCYLVRTPASGLSATGDIRRFGMLLTPGNFPGLSCAAGWLGLVFD